MYDPNNPQQSQVPQGPEQPGIPAAARGVAVRTTSLLDAVLGWLALSLFITTGGVFVYLTSGLPVPWFVFLILMFGLIFGVQFAVRAKNMPLAIGLFSLFAFVEGLFLGPVISIYLRVDPAAVGNAVLGTGGIFVFAAGVVWVTNRSFASWGKYLLIALFALILLSIVGFFVPVLGIGTIGMSLLLGVVFVGLTIFDFWRVKAARPGDDNALLIAMSLYLDFINLFLILLRIFGGNRR